jgi:Rieske Fe-S protein
MERREFLKTAIATCITAGMFSLECCTNYKTVTAGEETGKLKIKKSDFGEDKFIVVHTIKTNAPIYLSKQENGNYTATLMLCTHKSCELKPQGNILICPCHGSEFSAVGQVLKEPADQNLKKFETSSDENYIYILLK